MTCVHEGNTENWNLSYWDINFHLGHVHGGLGPIFHIRTGIESDIYTFERVGISYWNRIQKFFQFAGPRHHVCFKRAHFWKVLAFGVDVKFDWSIDRIYNSLWLINWLIDWLTEWLTDLVDCCWSWNLHTFYISWVW